MRTIQASVCLIAVCSLLGCGDQDIDSTPAEERDSVNVDLLESQSDMRLSVTSEEQAVRDDSHAHLVDKLRSSGLTEDQVHFAFSGLLRVKDLRTVDQYWRPLELVRRSQFDADMKFRREAYDSIVRNMGKESITHSAYTSIVQPLTSELPHLAPREQLDMYSERLDSLYLPESQRRKPTQLSDEDRFERDVRKSRLARRMRLEASILNYSENEFRKIFRIRSGSSIDDQYLSVHSLLGDSRFAVYEELLIPGMLEITRSPEFQGAPIEDQSEVKDIVREAVSRTPSVLTFEEREKLSGLIGKRGRDKIVAMLSGRGRGIRG